MFVVTTYFPIVSKPLSIKEVWCHLSGANSTCNKESASESF